MAAATLIYAGDPLAGTNLAGKLKQNAEGYYLDVVLGALDVFNSAGAMYTSEPALALFAGTMSPALRVHKAAGLLLNVVVTDRAGSVQRAGSG